MKTTDAWRLGFRAVVAEGPRSLLSFFGVAIGIAAVMLLSAVGEGARVYILEQFTQFGTNLLAINPGKTDTQGIPGVFGGTTQKLTEEDADVLRRLPGVRNVLPIAVGQGLVEAGNRGRSINVYGVTADLPEVWEFEVGQGTFVPEGEAHPSSADEWGTSDSFSLAHADTAPPPRRQLSAKDKARTRLLVVLGLCLHLSAVALLIAWLTGAFNSSEPEPPPAPTKKETPKKRPNPRS